MHARLKAPLAVGLKDIGCAPRRGGSFRFAVTSARLFGASVCLVLSIASVKAGKSVCIVCSGPDKVYRCPPGGSGNLRADIAAQIKCVKDVARSGGHKECRVSRTKDSCDALATATGADSANAGGNDAGQRISIGNTSIVLPAEGVGDEPAPQSLPSAQTEAEAAPSGDNAGEDDEPPRTMVEVGERAIEQSRTGIRKAGEQIERTGETIGEAVKGAWTCVTSLFGECD